MELRSYQSRAVDECSKHWASGKRSVCLVSPPGSGKTEMAMEAAARHVGESKVLWVVHQRELGQQAIGRLGVRFGDANVGAIMGGYSETRGAKIVVATVQSLLARAKPLDGFGFAYMDECHHFAASEWSKVRFVQPGGFRCELGGTATPERERGEPLGDIFEELVVAAHYSELIRDGYMMQPKIARPRRSLGSNWARNPLDAWAHYGKWRGILWVPSIDLAEHYAEQANRRRIPAACISERTTPERRARAVDDFQSGKVDLLTNVATLMEGIDFPQCRAAILGRRFRTIGAYLQATGRVLRPHKDKESAVVIDLTGCTVRHGLPYQDLEYSLKGKAIKGAGVAPVGGATGTVSPRVMGVDIVDDFGNEDRPSPVELADPDPKWWRAQKRREDRYWKNVKRYGAKIADQRLLEAMGL